MKANQIPKMTAVLLLDRDAAKVSVDVKAFQYEGETHVFLTDQVDAGSGSVARNCGVFIPQILDRFDLDAATTQFYRHVFKPASGSLFGRFELNWQDGELAHYTFAMLSTLGENRSMLDLIEQATPITFSYAQVKNLAAAV